MGQVPGRRTPRQGDRETGRQAGGWVGGWVGGWGSREETSRQASRHADKEVTTAYRQDCNNPSWKLSLDALSHSCTILNVITKDAQGYDSFLLNFFPVRRVKEYNSNTCRYMLEIQNDESYTAQSHSSPAPFSFLLIHIECTFNSH